MVGRYSHRSRSPQRSTLKGDPSHLLSSISAANLHIIGIMTKGKSLKSCREIPIRNREIPILNREIPIGNREIPILQTNGLHRFWGLFTQQGALAPCIKVRKNRWGQKWSQMPMNKGETNKRTMAKHWRYYCTAVKMAQYQLIFVVSGL